VATEFRDEDAARSLERIRSDQRAVVEQVIVPTWYWWAVGALVVAIGAAADTRRPALVVPVALACGLSIAGLTVWMIVGRGRAQVSRELLGERGAVLMAGFLWLLLAVSFGIAFGLRAAGVAHPGLIGCGGCALGLVVGGPRLMRSLRRAMLAQRAGS